MTSVTGVEVSPDLKTCKAFISVLGDEKSREETFAGLHSAGGFIRRELARSVNLRNTPEITFVVDQSIEYGVDMAKRIDEVIEADTAAQASRPQEEETALDGCQEESPAEGGMDA